MSLATPRPPYGLAPIGFAFPALATMAGRAPLGGPREVALACLLVARIVRDACSGPDELVADQQQRAQAVKHWLGAATLQPTVRNALSRLVDTTVTGDKEAIRAGLDSVMTVTANQLDSGARLELGRLVQTVAGQGTS